MAEPYGSSGGGAVGRPLRELPVRAGFPTNERVGFRYLHPSSYGGRIGAPVVRGVGGRMADPAEHAAMWELSERETGITLASILG